MVKIGRFRYACVLLLAIYGCSGPDPSGPARQALTDARLERVNVAWDRSKGVVHLKGVVTTLADRERAQMVTENAVGTSGRILNEITVQGAVDDVPDDVDERIRVEIKESLNSHPTLSVRPITVRVTDAVVTVQGRVQTVEESEIVSERVRKIQGVREVTNTLEVEEKL